VKCPTALTIAGSDSGGGAGIQADLRTFAFHQVHGTSAITCITAQNTVGVQKVEAVSAEMVSAQMESVVTDFRVQGIKTGMLLNESIIEHTTEMITRYGMEPWLVVDPVMVSRTGAQLIDDAAVTQLTNRLIPAAVLVTPNCYEAQILSGREIHTLDEMKTAAKVIHDQGANTVLVKGGAMTQQWRGIDVWFDGQEMDVLETDPVQTENNHGTGCTLSAAIAANLALGKDLKTAVQNSKTYVTAALNDSLDLGQGKGPLGHFFPLIR